MIRAKFTSNCQSSPQRQRVSVDSCCSACMCCVFVCVGRGWLTFLPVVSHSWTLLHLLLLHFKLFPSPPLLPHMLLSDHPSIPLTYWLKNAVLKPIRLWGSRGQGLLFQESPWLSSKMQDFRSAVHQAPTFVTTTILIFNTAAPAHAKLSREMISSFVYHQDEIARMQWSLKYLILEHVQAAAAPCAVFICWSFKGYSDCRILAAAQNTHSDVMGFDVVGALWGASKKKRMEEDGGIKNKFTQGGHSSDFAYPWQSF